MWKVRMNEVDWENQHLSMIIKTCDVLKDNVKQAKMLLTKTEPCLDHEFPRLGGVAPGG